MIAPLGVIILDDLRDALLGPLNAILCAIQQLAYQTIDALIAGCNLCLIGIGVTLQALVSLLPLMPTDVYTPDGAILGTINWILPLAQMLAVFTLLVSMWATILVTRIALNWLRAL